MCLILLVGLKSYVFIYKREEFCFWVELPKSVSSLKEVVDRFEDEVYERDYELDLLHGSPIHVNAEEHASESANNANDGAQNDVQHSNSETDSIVRGAGSVLAEHRAERKRRDVSLIGIPDEDIAPDGRRRKGRRLEAEDLQSIETSMQQY